MRYYVAIETNIEGFKLYKELWNKIGVDGIHAESMTEGIKLAVEVEKSKTDELFFISIVSDEINYMPQLKIMSEETSAPILIATSNSCDDERLEAINNGADYYGNFCKTHEKNIKTVISVINSIERRTEKGCENSSIYIHGDVLISKDLHLAFIADKEIKLTKRDMDILRFLIINRECVVSYEQIYESIWFDDDREPNKNYDLFHSAMKRLRKKIFDASEKYYIKNVREVGYCFTKK